MRSQKEVSRVLHYSLETIQRRVAVLIGCLLLGACAAQPSSPTRSTAGATKTETAIAVPENVAADYANAQTLMSVEDYAGAAQILENLTLSSPEYPAIATTLAIAWRELGRADDALAMLETSLAVHDSYAPGWNEVGILHREAGRFADAEAAYLKAVTVNPDYALAHFNFGILLDLYIADHPRALEHYQRYQSLVPNQDKQVERWIADISRRIERSARAASVAQ